MDVITRCSKCGHKWEWNTDEETPLCPNCGYDTIYEGKRTPDGGSVLMSGETFLNLINNEKETSSSRSKDNSSPSFAYCLMISTIIVILGILIFLCVN